MLTSGRPLGGRFAVLQGCRSAAGCVQLIWSFCMAEIVHPRGDKTTADSQNEWIRNISYEDINGEGRLFGGRLMEWIDEVAGVCAIRHCQSYVTTAAVDNLVFKHGAHQPGLCDGSQHRRRGPSPDGPLRAHPFGPRRGSRVGGRQEADCPKETKKTGRLLNTVKQKLWVYSVGLEQKSTKPVTVSGPMELFNAKVHQTYVRPWAYRLFQYKSLPMPEQMGDFTAKVRH